MSARADLLYVALQNGEELAELSLAHFRIGRMLDAGVGVLMDDHFGEGLQRLAHGDHLGEHVRAIAILFDHLFDRSDLPGNLAEADLQRPLFTG